ncbi:MAG TPA: DUF4437 domain-containing protein [Blastocatellia bacterium]
MPRPQVENLRISEIPKQKSPLASLPDGIRSRTLNHDPGTGAISLILDIPRGWETKTSAYNESEQEIFMLDGALEIGHASLTSGCYCYYPAGVLQGPWKAEEDATVVAIFESTPNFVQAKDSAPGARSDKSIEYKNTWTMEWVDPLKASDPSLPLRTGIFVKVLRVDEETGSSTHLAGAVAGWYAEGIEVHPVREENLTLTGDVHIGTIDAQTGYTMTVGSYYDRPKGVPHGPLATKNGNVNLVHTDGRLGIDYKDDPNAERIISEYFARYPWN